jgi:four helix bundle protein
MKVAHYKDLRVYTLAFESAMEVFELSRKWPSEEKYSLTDQIRRSSRSVCTNLAEAWRKRRYEAAFVSKLSDSDGEAAETEVHLDFALRRGYLPPEKHVRLRDHYDHTCRQLTNMMNDAASWCGAGCELREVPAEYVVEHESVERASMEERASMHSPLPRSNAPDAPHAPRCYAPRSPLHDLC